MAALRSPVNVAMPQWRGTAEETNAMRMATNLLERALAPRWATTAAQKRGG